MQENNLKTLTQKHPGLYGSYDSTTHTMELFLTAHGDNFDTWENEAEAIRRDATMKLSTVGIWVQDPSAPKIKEKPLAATAYVPEIDTFVPCVNVTCSEVSWETAYNRASALAGYCTAILQRTGKLPSQRDIVEHSGFGDARVYYPNGGDSVVTNMLRRIQR